MVVIEVVKEALWLEGNARERRMQDQVITIHYDNQSAIQLPRNHVYHERTKHILISSCIL